MALDIYETRGGFRTAATSTMERFVMHPILDAVAAALDPPLETDQNLELVNLRLRFLVLL